MEYFFRRYIIIPYLLQKASFFTEDILMRNAMRRIKTRYIQPTLLSLDRENNSKRNISSFLC